MKKSFPNETKVQQVSREKLEIKKINTKKDVNQIITRASATVVTTTNKREESSEKGAFTFPYMSFLYETGW